MAPSHHVAYSPSPYVMYKFYSFPDHDTEIVPHSPCPAFNNIKHFPLSMDRHLDSYLRTEVRGKLQLASSSWNKRLLPGALYVP